MQQCRFDGINDALQLGDTELGRGRLRQEQHIAQAEEHVHAGVERFVVLLQLFDQYAQQLQYALVQVLPGLSRGGFERFLPGGGLLVGLHGFDDDLKQTLVQPVEHGFLLTGQFHFVQQAVIVEHDVPQSGQMGLDVEIQLQEGGQSGDTVGVLFA